MTSLFLSILCSVSVAILFKKLRPNLFDTFMVIAINYLTAIVLAISFFEISNLDINVDFKILLPIIILMPLIFYFFNKSIIKSGIIKTDIAQRISLIIPISAAFLIFKESITLFKWIGITLGFLSVFLMIYKKNVIKTKNSIYLLLVFVGYGIIDVLFKQIALQSIIPFTTYLLLIFIGCFVISFIVILFLKNKHYKAQNKTFVSGVILGILNFSNIYFYLNAHKKFTDNPSTVFAVMNFGVIGIATLIGVFFFKEKLSRQNILGIILAILAICFILFSQYKSL